MKDSLEIGPFDFAQGSWAKAVVFLGVEGRVTFAPRIAGAILERWSRDRALRLRSGSLSFCAQGALCCLGSVSLSNRWSMAPSTSLRDPGRKPCLLDAGTFHNFRPKNSQGNSCIGGLGIWALRLRSGVLGCLGSVSLSNRWSMAPSTLLRGPGLLRIGELVEPLVNGPFDIALRLRLRLRSGGLRFFSVI